MAKSGGALGLLHWRLTLVIGDDPVTESFTLVSALLRCRTSGRGDRRTMGRTRVYTTT
jgi:hypothetical protein